MDAGLDKAKVQRFNGKKMNGHNNVISLYNIYSEYTEQMTAYKMTIRMYSTFSKIFGIKVGYDWIPRRCVMYWFTYFLLFLAWVSIIYTVQLHYIHGNYKRMLEPLAIVGVASSVTKENCEEKQRMLV